MSKSLVRARQFKPKRRSLSIKRAIKKAGIQLPEISFDIPKSAKKVVNRTMVIVILFCFSFFFLIKGVFFQNKFMIENIKFSQATIDTFEDVDLYNEIYNIVKGENYYVLKYLKKTEIITQIKQKFPIIESISFQMELKEEKKADVSMLGREISQSIPGNTGLAAVLRGNVSVSDYQAENIKSGEIEIPERKTVSNKGGILGVDIKFIKPTFIVKLGNKRFGVRDENEFWEIQSNMALGNDVFAIDTPQYLSGIQTLSGFFFEIPLATFKKAIPLVQESFPNMVRFVYLAGSPRVAIFTEDEQVLYISLLSSELFDTQVGKYELLREYYSGFNQVATMDLGALDENKVIIRKK